MSAKLRVGVVGCGIGRKHMAAYRALEQYYELAVVCDLDEMRAQSAAEEFGAGGFSTRFEQLCQRGDLDVIDLCTPPATHFDQIPQVLDSGKHCICEKPLVGSLEQADAVRVMEKRSGKRLMPIFQKRSNLGVQQLKFLLEQEGLAGKLYLASVETSWRRHKDYYAVPWRGKWSSELGGVLLTHAIHAHDTLSYLCGSVQSVFARMTTRVNPIEVEDCASASLLMADGAPASLSATLGSAEQITRHRFCFEGFSAELHMDAKPGTVPLKVVGDTPKASARIEQALARFTPIPQGFEGQFWLFYEALKHDRQLPVTVEDARASLELISALYLSASSDRDVQLPITKEDPVYKGWLGLRGKDEG